MPPEAGAPRPPGLLGSLSRFARTLISLAQTRLEILGTELQEESVRFTRTIVLVMMAVFCVQMAILLGVALLVVWLWETHRLATMGTLFVVFGGAAAVLLVLLRQRAQLRPRPFAATIAEFAKDRERLRGRGSDTEEPA